MNHIILIGFMGAGKTSVGRRLAKVLHLDYVDTDDMIEEQQQMQISVIFAKHGEPYFRDLETDVLKQLQKADDRKVIAVGGGLPVREENRVLLRELGTVIYLKAEVDTLVGRLSGDTTRPKLQGGDLRERIVTLMQEREALYEEVAACEIRTDRKRLFEVVAEITEKVNGKQSL